MTAHRATLEIELLADATFSAKSATTGGHRALKHIPGSAMLGLAAARLPRELDRWTVLHSGRVRFGDGLPVPPDGSTAWPFPASLFEKKDASLITSSRADSKRELLNLALAERPGGEQWEAAKDAYLSVGEPLRTHVPSLSERMKTAIDSERGVARERMLFSLETLAAGQIFRSEVEADAGAFSADPAEDSELFASLVAALGSIEGLAARLGRSRSSEFGEALIRVQESQPPEKRVAVSGNVSVWALSHTSMLDECGRPTFMMRPEQFGLRGGRFEPGKSSISVRSIVPFNGFRGVNDVERQVICAGSVVTFSGVQEGLSGRIRIGAARQAGLGHVWIDPLPLRAVQIQIYPAMVRPVPEHPPIEPASALFHWMNARVAVGEIRFGSSLEVSDSVDKFLDLYVRAARYLGQTGDGRVGPSKSQWRAVAGIARACNSDRLEGAVFGDGGPAKANDPDWAILIGPGSTFRDSVRDHVMYLAKRSDIDLPHTIALIAREMASRLQEKAPGKNAEVGR